MPCKVENWYSSSYVQYFSKRRFLDICDALRDLVPFVQFKKREKHPRRIVNFSKVAGFKHHAPHLSLYL